MAILTILLALAHQEVTRQRAAPAPAWPARSISNDDEPSPIEHVPIRRQPPVSQDRPPTPPMPRVMTIPPPPPPIVPAPPVPPAPPRAATPLRPATPPQSWVTPDDYPASAIRAGDQGVVSFQLDVDGTGAVANCTVTVSSGSALLDEQTCALLQSRARFHPARDGKGTAIPASFASRFRWELPEPAPEALASWAGRLRFVVGDDGTVMSCTPLLLGTTSDVAADCEQGVPTDMLSEFRAGASGPVTILIDVEHRVEGMALPDLPTPEAGLHLAGLAEIAFEVDVEGKVQNCRVVRAIGHLPPGACEVPGQYELPPAGTASRKVTTLFALHTDAPLPAIQDP